VSDPVNDSVIAPEEITVVVAEDETIIRLDLVETLVESGLHVLAAVADGQAALDAARKHRPDLVIMDISMPVRDGISAAEQIINEGISPVIMLTAFAQTEMLQQAAAAGAFGYLTKPLRHADLMPTIIMARSRWNQFVSLGEELDLVKGRRQADEVILKAKNFLMRAGDLSEEAAFAQLRGLAMDRRLTIAEVASQVVAAVSNSDFGDIS
jgi:two-component system, response regulator PdtaR